MRIKRGLRWLCLSLCRAPPPRATASDDVALATVLNLYANFLSLDSHMILLALGDNGRSDCS
jgi:hypothetical protein